VSSPTLNEISGGTAVNLESPGFLNLGADLGADISLVSMVLLGVLFTLGEPLGLFCRLHTVDISGWDVRFVA